MKDGKKKIGFALTGSFCTFEEIMPQVQALVAAGYDIVPVMSEYAYATDTRFGRAADFAGRLEAITGNTLIHTIVQAEPIGPQKLLDLLLIAPCTGNTLGKLAAGVTDTCVTMAAKSHLRNQRPLLLAASTNDALGNCAKNIGNLLNYKNIYFVPMRQDDAYGKPRSIVADFTRIPDAVEQALEHTQIQPIYVGLTE